MQKAPFGSLYSLLEIRRKVCLYESIFPSRQINLCVFTNLSLGPYGKLVAHVCDKCITRVRDVIYEDEKISFTTPVYRS
jgi:hypothetical protein